MEKTETDKVVAEAGKELEQLLVRFNVAHAGFNRAEKLTLSMVMELASAVNDVFQQLGYGAASRLRQELEKAYSTVRVPCAVAWNLVSRAAATSIRLKDEDSGDEKEADPSADRPARTLQGSAKETRPRRPGKRRSTQC